MVNNGVGVSGGHQPTGGSLIVLIRLLPGWELDPASASLRCLAADGSPTYTVAVPDLPHGAELLPALPLRRRGKPLAAERELERYLHLHLRLPTRETVDTWLTRVRAWEFVESARVLKGIVSI